MWSSLLGIAAKAAKKVPWWKILLMTLGAAAATAIGKKLVDKILQDKDLTFEEKLERLEKLKSSGKINDEEYEAGRKSLFEKYSQQK